MAFLPRVSVGAPVPRGKRYGLFAAANGPVPLTEREAAGGIDYEPVSCGTTHEYPVVCGPDESPSESPSEFVKLFDADESRVQADPFIVYASLQCGSIGKDSEAMRTRVLQRLNNGEQTGAERGFALQLASSGAPELASPDPTNIVDVLATLEQWVYGLQAVPTVGGGAVAGAEYGNVAYLHATPRAAAYMQAQHLLIKEGPIWRTAMGTVVVLGGGYSGALPGAAAAIDGQDAIYITGQTTVFQQLEEQIPDPEQTFNRTANQWMVIAERAYVVAFDCVAAASAFEYGVSSP